ncbi:MAG TPA: thiamine phosphate synthase [Kofleriaceae bacterium]|nr:thiamine phosphate synthase [Kofleriaceae bacterium]
MWRAPVCLVAITDRRRMVAPDVLARGDWDEIARAFAAAVAPIAAPGVLVQVREKDLDGGPLLALVQAALGTGAAVVVNDRLDVALAAGAHGVHLPEHGLSIESVRGILGSRDVPAGFTIGASVHSIEGAHAAAEAGAELVQLGPIWETPGKGPPLGPSALAAARPLLSGRARVARLVAVGGIDGEDRARQALRSGADAVAAIRATWAHQLDIGRVLAGL